LDFANIPHAKNICIKRGILCNSPSENLPCEYILLTAPTIQQNSLNSVSNSHKKPLVVLTARIHPGETVSSFLMKGALDFLLSQDPLAIYLREAYNFFIVPMLNPDGVFIGNNRFDAFGVDLNRKFNMPSRRRQPTIYYLKKAVNELSKECGIVFYCDMHGHGKNKGMFCFGNTDTANSAMFKIFPMVLGTICKNFTYEGSYFGIEKTKMTTARVTAWKDYDLFNSFTLEGSVFNSRKPNRINENNIEFHYNQEEYQEIGKNVCQAIAICHKLSIISFIQSGKIGGMIFEKPYNPNETEKVNEKSLKEIYEMLVENTKFNIPEEIPKNYLSFTESFQEKSLSFSPNRKEGLLNFGNESFSSFSNTLYGKRANLNKTGSPLDKRKTSRNSIMMYSLRKPNEQLPEYATNPVPMNEKSCRTCYKNRNIIANELQQSTNNNIQAIPEINKSKNRRVLILKKCVPLVFFLSNNS